MKEYKKGQILISNDRIALVLESSQKLMTSHGSLNAAEYLATRIYIICGPAAMSIQMRTNTYISRLFKVIGEK
jgi:hypothetical protein